MVNFYIYYNIYKIAVNPKRYTDIEIYCSTGQIGTASGTKLTPLDESAGQPFDSLKLLFND